MQICRFAQPLGLLLKSDTPVLPEALRAIKGWLLRTRHFSAVSPPRLALGQKICLNIKASMPLLLSLSQVESTHPTVGKRQLQGFIQSGQQPTELLLLEVLRGRPTPTTDNGRRHGCGHWAEFDLSCQSPVLLRE